MNVEQWHQQVEFAGIYAPVKTYCKLLDRAPAGADQEDIDFLAERIVTLSIRPPRMVRSKIGRRWKRKLQAMLS